MTIVQLCISIIFLMSNLFLIFKKNILGWIYGIAGCLLGIWYFYILNLSVYMIYNVAMIPIMLSGMTKSTGVLRFTIYFMGFIVLMSMGINFVDGNLTFIEVLSAMAFLFGTAALTSENEKAGWLLILIGNLSMAYVLYPKHQDIMVLFQLISAFVSLLAMYPKYGKVFIWGLCVIVFSFTLIPWILLVLNGLEDAFISYPRRIFRKPVTCYHCKAVISQDLSQQVHCPNCLSLLVRKRKQKHVT